jgi:hypothetical protein
MANVQHGSDIAKPGVPAGLFPRSGRAAATESQSGAYSAPATIPDHPGPQGLVTCATTARDLETVTDAASLTIADVWRPAFPKADLVSLAAGLFEPLPAWRGEEGPRYRIVVSPGALAIESHDAAKAERTYERQVEARVKWADMVGQYLAEHGTYPPEPQGREITSWSRRSRSRMTRRLCELDYAPLLASGVLPAMLTLTYPGDWLAVAPNGKAVKKHLRAFLERWRRTWGDRLAGVWKLEFQGRGAPHFHILTTLPDVLTADGLNFREWLSATWAAVVAHPDPEQYRRHQLAGTGVDYAEGLRARDPKRIAVYFTKHGTYAAKEYQNQVPAEWQAPGQGPGRFWGYWGLERCTAAVEVRPQLAIDAARVMRRWAGAQGTTREIRAPRVKGGVWRPVYPDVIGLAGAEFVEGHPRIRKRKLRRRVRRMRYGRGWVSLNDAPAFASAMARYLTT